MAYLLALLPLPLAFFTESLPLRIMCGFIAILILFFVRESKASKLRSTHRTSQIKFKSDNDEDDDTYEFFMERFWQTQVTNQNEESNPIFLDSVDADEIKRQPLNPDRIIEGPAIDISIIDIGVVKAEIARQMELMAHHEGDALSLDMISIANIRAEIAFEIAQERAMQSGDPSPISLSSVDVDKIKATPREINNALKRLHFRTLQGDRMEGMAGLHPSPRKEVRTNRRRRNIPVAEERRLGLEPDAEYVERPVNINEYRIQSQSSVQKANDFEQDDFAENANFPQANFEAYKIQKTSQKDNVKDNVLDDSLSKDLNQSFESSIDSSFDSSYDRSFNTSDSLSYDTTFDQSSAYAQPSRQSNVQPQMNDNFGQNDSGQMDQKQRTFYKRQEDSAFRQRDAAQQQRIRRSLDDSFELDSNDILEQAHAVVRSRGMQQPEKQNRTYQPDMQSQIDMQSQRARQQQETMELEARQQQRALQHERAVRQQQAMQQQRAMQQQVIQQERAKQQNMQHQGALQTGSQQRPQEMQVQYQNTQSIQNVQSTQHNPTLINRRQNIPLSRAEAQQMTMQRQAQQQALQMQGGSQHVNTQEQNRGARTAQNRQQNVSQNVSQNMSQDISASMSPNIPPNIPRSRAEAQQMAMQRQAQQQAQRQAQQRQAQQGQAQQMQGQNTVQNRLHNTSQIAPMSRAEAQQMAMQRQAQQQARQRQMAQRQNLADPQQTSLQVNVQTNMQTDERRRLSTSISQDARIAQRQEQNIPITHERRAPLTPEQIANENRKIIEMQAEKLRNMQEYPE